MRAVVAALLLLVRPVTAQWIPDSTNAKPGDTVAYHVILPSASGRYTVQLRNPLGILVSRGVLRIVAPPTVTKPAGVTTLAGLPADSASVTLSFTEVTDGSGLPASYDVREAAGVMSWGSAASVTQGTCSSPVSGATVGTVRRCTVTGLAPATTYQFQVVAFRGVLNVSAVFGPLSNVTTVTTMGSGGAPPPPPPPPPPPAPPPPPVAGEPVFSAGDQMIYQDNMDGYASTAAMWADKTSAHFQQIPGEPVDPAPNDQLLIPGRGGAGKALRTQYNGATQEGHGWKTVNVPTTSPRQHVFFTYWGRVTFSSPLNGPLGLKWFEAFHPNAANSRTQWSITYHDKIASASTFWRVNPESRGEYGMQPVQPFFRDLGGSPPLPPPAPDVVDGQWHRYAYEYWAQSASGARDGVARMWVDGKKVIDISAAAVNVTPPGGYKVWCTTSDLDALAVNQGVSYANFWSVVTESTAPFTVDLDDFQWWVRP